MEASNRIFIELKNILSHCASFDDFVQIIKVKGEIYEQEGSEKSTSASLEDLEELERRLDELEDKIKKLKMEEEIDE